MSTRPALRASQTSWASFWVIAIIFEVALAAGQRDAYLGIAADLRELLDGVDGFFSVERLPSNQL